MSYTCSTVDMSDERSGQSVIARIIDLVKFADSARCTPALSSLAWPVLALVLAQQNAGQQASATHPCTID